MRWTDSKDGRRRATLRIEFRVDPNDAIAAIGQLLFETGDLADVLPPTRREVEQALRERYHSSGAEWAMDTTHDQELRRRAEEIFANLWPGVPS